MIYLDHAATTPVPRAVADAMYEVLTEQFGNPSSQYPMGLEMKRRVEAWRQTVADALGCEARQLFFTSCGTEADNWAVTAACWQNRHLGRHIVTTAVEHSAVLEACRWMERQGYEVTYLAPAQDGSISAEQVLDAVRPDTALVSCMLVNNELGNVYPIADIARGLAAKNPQTLLHTDAVQGFLKVPCSAKTLGADFVTISAHKIGGPKGIGALYIGPRVRNPQPLLAGGGQEGGLRAGTEATAQIAGFAKAVELRLENLEEKLRPHGADPGLRRGAALRHPRPADPLRSRRRAPHPLRLPGGLAQPEHRQRPGQPGHLHLRRLRLPPGQAQPRDRGLEAVQEGLRRGDPPELRPGDRPRATSTPVRTPCGATTTPGCPCCKAIFTFQFQEVSSFMFRHLHREPGFYKRLFLLALPLILQNLITTSLGFVDTFMVGLLGQT